MISNRPLFYAHGSRRAPRSRGPGMLLAVAAVALLLVLSWFFRAPLGELLWQLGAPLMRARHAPVLQTAAPADRDALYAENLELKRLLGRSAEFERIVAAVLLRPPATPYDTLVVDAGSAHGVALGDVVAAGGVVLGEVTQLYSGAARATLYSAPGEEHQALLQRGGSVLPITLQGQGGGSLSAQVPAGSGVQLGDEATLASLYTGVVARVVGVDRGESDSFSTLYFRLPTPVSGVRFIEIWKLPQTGL